MRRRAEQLHEALERGEEPGPDRSGLAAAALAGVVHLVTAAVVLGSVALLVAGPWPLRVLGGCGLLLGYALRPRFGRLRPDPADLARAEAPELYALADRVAAAVGAEPVHLIRVTGEFGASFERIGLRRRAVLRIGLPYWAVLTGPERVALLGHELGHDVNGDPRRGRWLRSAESTLREWRLVAHRVEPERDFVGFTIRIVRSVALVPRRLLGLGPERLLALLERLGARSGQRAEYLADRFSATVAPPAAVRGMLAGLLLAPSAEAAATRIRARPGEDGRPGRDRAVAEYWAELSGLAAGLPPHELERRLRLSAREFGAADPAHPPTHLRIRLLTARPVDPAPVAFRRIEQEKVEAELAGARARVGAELLGH
ncbi:M48 family metallopeptidase [Kitasatospora sp. NPDC051853]|uniref:M48 family metallopeptidase n=1 Tax=Kitasatospora sp. NPDC051853 TaxID=3364058 RepID=UPI00379B2185